MRALLVLAIAAAGGFTVSAAFPGDAEAYHETRRAKTKYYRGYRSSEYERARANALDPGGDYKNYPDWARSALSPKSGGSSRSR
jgi:hypothetical protein